MARLAAASYAPHQRRAAVRSDLGSGVKRLTATGRVILDLFKERSSLLPLGVAGQFENSRYGKKIAAYRPVKAVRHQDRQSDWVLVATF